jgi:hypothetical protein
MIQERLRQRAAALPEAPGQITSATRVNQGETYTTADIFAGATGPQETNASLYSAQEIAYYNEARQTADMPLA